MFHSIEQWLIYLDKLAQDDYIVIDEFINDEQFLLLKNFYLSRLHLFSIAGVGALDKNVVNKSVRSDRTFWLDRNRDAELEPFWLLLEETIQVFNRYCFLSLSGYEFHFAHYPKGSHYEKHLDQFMNRNNRMISMVVYLNQDWQKGRGGELELFKSNGASQIIEPFAKRCVLFKSAEVPHQVIRSNTDRYSLTGWLLYQPSALGKFLG